MRGKKFGIIKRQCSWCGLTLGIKEEDTEIEFPVTHGICESCIGRFFSDLSISLKDFLDRLGVPVLLMESEPKVLTANKQAQELLGKKLPDIEGRKAGEVIECAYAKTPEGCGNTVHCKSCTIRNTVLETFETGKSFRKVPAYPDIELLSAIKTLVFQISTEKVGNFVLLAIEHIREQDQDQTEDWFSKS